MEAKSSMGRNSQLLFILWMSFRYFWKKETGDSLQLNWEVYVIFFIHWCVCVWQIGRRCLWWGRLWKPPRINNAVGKVPQNQTKSAASKLHFYYHRLHLDRTADFLPWLPKPSTFTQIFTFCMGDAVNKDAINTFVAFVGICLIIIGKWLKLSQRWLWFWWIDC